MVEKVIKYHDFEGNEREDKFYFFLNQVQFSKIDTMFPNGLEEYGKKVAQDRDAGAMLNLIDLIVREAYGERVGVNYTKLAPNGQKLVDFFVNTEAYDNLITELISTEDAMVNFLTGCLPKKAQEQANEKLAQLRKEEAKKKAAEQVDVISSGIDVK